MLKSKLKKLFPSKKRRPASTEMGNCAGSGTKGGREGRAAGKPPAADSDVSKYTHGELVLK